MDTTQLLSIISFLLQEEEDDENDDFMAILSIMGIFLIFSFYFYHINPFIQFRLRNGKHKSSTSLLFKLFHEEESDKKSPKRQQGRRKRLILPGYPEMVFRYQDPFNFQKKEYEI